MASLPVSHRVPRAIHVLLTLLFASLPLTAEMFFHPAHEIDRKRHSEYSSQVLISVEKFIPGMEQAFTPSGGESSGNKPDPAEFSWLYTISGRIPVELSPGLTFRMQAFMSFLSSEVEGDFWGFDASGFYSDISPILMYHLTPEHQLGLRFSHSCKHDLDQSRRLVIEQSAGMGWSGIFPSGDRRVLPETELELFAEYLLPVKLPGQPENFTDVRLSLASRADIYRISEGLTLWGHVQGSAGFGQAVGSKGSGQIRLRLDYRAEMGIRFRPWSVFISARRISDPYIRTEGPGVHVFSIGLRIEG